MKWMAFLLIGVLMCAVPGCMSGDEAVGRNKELEDRLREAQGRIASLEQERKSLEEENRRLNAQLAAATEGNSLEMTDQQRQLDKRAAALDMQERRIAEREKILEEREQKLATREQEFHRATNMTMVEIGEARRVVQDYDRMRAERNAAVEKSDFYLKLNYGILVAFCALVASFIFVAVRYYYRDRQQRREADFRSEQAAVLRQMLSPQLGGEQARVAMAVLDHIAGPSGHGLPPASDGQQPAADDDRP